MQKIIVSDTSCLILFSKINKLDILQKLFRTITVTKIISEEFGEKLPDFIQIENPKDRNYQKILENLVDKGEASALALALEKDDCLLIIDDNKGRKQAKQLGLTYTGTLGILILAKQKGLITSLGEILSEIQKTNFRINQNLIDKALKTCNE